jgi:hypothetical protein|tara:strand:+ start:1039 stop:1722 length:684 start_codon:yes stop_codon:yes gene_type:complete
MTRRYVFIAAASMAMLVACSGSDDQVRVSGPDPVTAPSITRTPDTTQPAPAPTTPAITETVTATALGPTTSTAIDPIAEIEAAVQQARLNGQAAFAAAEADPRDQLARGRLASFQTGARLSAAVADLDELAENGLAVRPGEPDLSRIVFPKGVVLPDGAASREAFLEECRVNSDVLYTIARKDEQIDAVVDDQVFSYLSNLRYVLEENQWKHESGERLKRIVGSDAC